MAYKLKLKQSLEDGVRRIAVDQLDKALLQPADDAARAVWVHETRKALKRTRALLRLVRSGLEHATWDAENAALRDIARSLSPMRDRDILRQIMANLAAGGDKSVGEALARFEKIVEAPLHDAIPGKAAGSAIAEACKQISAARDRLAHIKLEGDLPGVLADGIARGLHRGAKALARVEAEASAENLHELRKAVQIYWRHMVLVKAAWPDVMSARAEAARELAQMLGEVQDLAVLAAAAEARNRGSAGRRRDAELIIAGCRKRQEARQAVAIPLATRLFASPHTSAGQEVARCWQAAMQMAVETSRRRKAAPDPQPRPRPRPGLRPFAILAGRGAWPSGSNLLKCRIQVLQLHTGVGGREVPVGLDVG